MSNFKHGHKRKGAVTPEYQSWTAMQTRCSNEKIKQWADYGGRRITVCKRWSKFENFLADMGPRPKGYSLDRINNDRAYSKQNCKWSTRKEQANNRRVRCDTTWVLWGGKKCRVFDVAIELKINRVTVMYRIRRGMTPIDALTTPLHQGQGKRKPGSNSK